MNAAVETTIPAIGQHWAAHGGTYIGTRLIEGVAHHIVIPGGIEHDSHYTPEQPDFFLSAA